MFSLPIHLCISGLFVLLILGRSISLIGKGEGAGQTLSPPNFPGMDKGFEFDKKGRFDRDN